RDRARRDPRARGALDRRQHDPPRRARPARRARDPRARRREPQLRRDPLPARGRGAGRGRRPARARRARGALPPRAARAPVRARARAGRDRAALLRPGRGRGARRRGLGPRPRGLAGRARRPVAAVRAAALPALVALVAAALPARAGREEDLALVRRAVREGRAPRDAYERGQRGLLAALESLDQTAQVLEREVASAGRRAEAAGRESAALGAEAAAAEQRVPATRHALAGRAAALYRAGELGSLRLLFSSGGLREFLGRMQLLRRLVARDAELLAQHRAATAALAEKREAA